MPISTCFRFLAVLVGAGLWACGGPGTLLAEDLPLKLPAELANVQPEAPAWLGVLMEVVRNPQEEEDEALPGGVGVVDVVEMGPAQKAGIKKFDRLLKLEGKALKDPEDLRKRVMATKPGTVVALRILREGKEQEVKVTLEKMPAQPNLLVFPGATELPVKPDKVQFNNRPQRAAEAALPDVVLLRDGNRLEGKMQSLDETNLGLKLKSGHDVSLLLAEVETVRVSGEAKARSLPVGVLLRDGGWLAAAKLSLANGKFSLTLANGGHLVIDRALVAEVGLSTDDAQPIFAGGTDLDAGWRSVPETAWTLQGGAWKCNPSLMGVLGRKFIRLPASLEFSFEVSPPLSQGGVVTLFAYRADNTGGMMDPGRVQIGIGANAVNVTHFDGRRYYSLQPLKPESLVRPPPIDAGKPMRYAILCDRLKGLLVLMANGVEISRYEIAKLSPEDLELAGTAISFHGPAALAISNPTVRPWYGYRPKEEGKIAREDQVVVGDQEAISGTVVKISDRELTLNKGGAVARTKPLLLRLNPTDDQAGKPAGRLWVEMKDGSNFSADSLQLADGRMMIKTAFAGEVTLPLEVLRRVTPSRPAEARMVAQAGETDILTFADGRQLTGSFVPPMTDGKLRLKLPAAQEPLEFPADDLVSLRLAPKGDPAPTAGLAVRLRNGDWLPGELTGLDASSITLKTPFQESLKMDRSTIQSLFPAPTGAIVADGGSGRMPWPLAASGNASQFVLLAQNDVRRPTYSYADGNYTLRSPITDFNGQRDGLALPLGDASTAVSVEFTCSGFASYLPFLLLDGQGALSFSITCSGNTVQVSRAPRRIGDPNLGAFARSEQFTLPLPGNAVLGSEVRLQIVLDPRARVLHLWVDGKKIGTCRFKKDEPWPEVRHAVFFPPPGLGRRFSVSNVWIAPWSGRLGEAQERAAGEAAVLFANGDETVGKVVKLAGDALELETADAGSFSLPLARIQSMEFHPPSAGPEAAHHVRLHDRGLLSASAVKIGGQTVMLTTALGELTLPLGMVKEITFPKK